MTDRQKAKEKIRKLIEKQNSGYHVNDKECKMLREAYEITKNFYFVRKGENGICRSRQAELRNKAAVSDE